MIARFIVGCVFVGFFKPMINFGMQNCILSNGDAPTPPPPPRWGVSLELIDTIMQLDLGVYGILETKMMGFVIGVIGKWSKVVVFAAEPAFYYLFESLNTCQLPSEWATSPNAKGLEYVANAEFRQQGGLHRRPVKDINLSVC